MSQGILLQSWTMLWLASFLEQTDSNQPNFTFLIVIASFYFLNLKDAKIKLTEQEK